MRAYLHTGPRGKFAGRMDASINRVFAASTKEFEISIYATGGPQVINIRLSRDEAKYLADMLNAALKEAPSVV